MPALPREITKIDIGTIYVGPRQRTVNADRVAALAASIKDIGLLTPLTVRIVPEMEIDGEINECVPVLIAGRHRMEALSKLGIESAPCIEIESDDIDAQLWEIAENLHRAELTALERDQHVAKWIELSEQRKVSQPATPGGKQPSAKGVRAAERELGIKRDDASRALKVASLSDEAKEAAKETGLDDNRTALLEAAKAPAQQQATVIHQIAARKSAPLAADPLNDLEAEEKQVAALMSAWNRASQKAREEFLCRIDGPAMDKRWNP